MKKKSKKKRTETEIKALLKDAKIMGAKDAAKAHNIDPSMVYYYRKNFGSHSKKPGPKPKALKQAGSYSMVVAEETPQAQEKLVLLMGSPSQIGAALKEMGR